MRIVIDMQGAQTESRFRGIGRYTRSLVHEIILNGNNHEIILALNGLFPESIDDIRRDFSKHLPQESIKTWYNPIRQKEDILENSWIQQSAEYIREAFLLSLKPDIIFITSLFEGYEGKAITSIGRFDRLTPVTSILYDFIPLINAGTYLNKNPTYSKYYKEKISYLEKANQWLAISDSVANEGIIEFPLAIPKIINISGACDSSIFQPQAITLEQKQSILANLNIPSPDFILYTGGADARKNLVRLIQSYTSLPLRLRNIYPLVLAGKMGEDEKNKLQKLADAHSIAPHKLIFTGYITDSELAQLYNLCTVFIFPSWHEGFGLPALEAMSCGAAVIGSNTSSIPEIIGQTDALFDPYDNVSITAKLIQVLEDNNFRYALQESGLKQAKKFSWQNCAQICISAFEKLYTDYQLPKQHPASYQEKLLPNLIQAIANIAPRNPPENQLLSLAYAISRIQVTTHSKQLFIDISELVQRDARTGIQRVTRSILRELVESPPSGYTVTPVYATQNTYGYYHAKQFTANLIKEEGTSKTYIDATPIDCHPGDIFLGLDLQHHVVEAQKEYLKKAHRDGVSVFFIVYDLLPILKPQFFPAKSAATHRQWLTTLLGFDGVICISKSVAEELAAWQTSQPHFQHPLPNDKILWFHLGADIHNSLPSLGMPSDAAVILRQLSMSPTFLVVGTIEPRKGHQQVLAAFEELWSESIEANLVIIGKQGWMTESIVEQLHTHPMLEKCLFWLEGISDEYLEKIYAHSSCLIAASEGEGFGLPLIEAAQHNLPLIARDIPVFKEVAGDNAHYFTGQSPSGLAKAIKQWLDLRQSGQHPAPQGIAWLTWKESAQMLMAQVYALASPSHSG